MKIDEFTIKALVCDWRDRSSGLQKRALALNRKDYRTSKDFCIAMADLQGKAAAYEFAALDLLALLRK